MTTCDEGSGGDTSSVHALSYNVATVSLSFSIPILFPSPPYDASETSTPTDKKELEQTHLTPDAVCAIASTVI